MIIAIALSAVAASIAVAILIAHTQYNSDIVEGWVMLAAAFFVISMIWFMHRAARTMKGSFEEKVAKYTGPAGVSKIGLFFFVFLLVLREGGGRSRDHPGGNRLPSRSAGRVDP